MPVSATVKRVFWFDDHKTPNVADVLAKEADFAVHRLAFDGPEDKNWAVMATCRAYCMTSARDVVPDQYKGTPALIERCQELLVISTSGAGYDLVNVAACTDAGVLVVNQAGANAEGLVFDRVALGAGVAEDLQRLLVLFAALRRERDVHLRGGAAALAGVGLVDENDEGAPRCSLPISSRMNGNFWTVVMMILLPAARNRRRSPECSACPTVAATWANCLMVLRICLSSTRRSVTTTTESKIALLPCSSPTS
jgi:D-isomer specific 2-hydroxyacid dehydrogenase, catalytic domain